MKNLILTIVMTIICVIVFGQARVGSTASEIKSEFKESKYKLKTGYDKDNDYYISIETARATVVYYFNSEKICTMTIIIPDNQGALNIFVETYNNQYVIKSSTSWRMYNENGIANIELIYPETGGYFFIWTSN